MLSQLVLSCARLSMRMMKHAKQKHYYKTLFPWLSTKMSNTFNKNNLLFIPVNFIYKLPVIFWSLLMTFCCIVNLRTHIIFFFITRCHRLNDMKKNRMNNSSHFFSVWLMNGFCFSNDIFIRKISSWFFSTFSI